MRDSDGSAIFRQTTKGEGDCAFHAALGEWNEKTSQFETNDIAGKRKKVADAIVNGKAIRIEGGTFRLVGRQGSQKLMKRGCQHRRRKPSNQL